jgi:basic membrane protein A
MNGHDVGTHYQTARKLATKEYMKNVSKGQSGYLPFLEGVLKNVDILSEVDLGIIDIPLRKITGTYTYSRSISFASNFMPLLGRNTEFGQKWMGLCRAHLNEGIRDAIKVYEYLNWFYVVEGNKRVSVLKYFDGYSIMGRVTRLIPRKDEDDPDIKMYYEFLEFNKKTGISCIWFSRENSFRKLLKYLEDFEPSGRVFGDKYKHFANSIFLNFRKVYHEVGGGELPITTGDAFLEYVDVYGIPAEIDEEDLRLKLKSFVTELEQLSREKAVDVQTGPLPEREGSIITTITTFVKPKKKVKVAFVHAKNIRESSWTYSHEMGRAHVDKTLGDQVTTSFLDNVPQSLEAYGYMKELVKKGNEVIFATSPSFIQATLKTALEYPNVKFLNCSETHSYKHVNTYFGRIHEPRFLAGVTAGAVTCSNILGYVGTFPSAGVINGINSFALGAKMSNPQVKVKVAWTNAWDSAEKAEKASTLLIQAGADIISHHDTLSSREFSKEYGVHTVVCNIDKTNCRPNEYIAAPVWNWGIFYERMLRNILNDTWWNISDILGSGQKPINFWWGMDSGIVDFFYSRRLVPRETQKLIDFIKRMIISGEFVPFTGPIYDRKGKLRIERDETATHEEIITMDWLVDVIDSEIKL